MGKSRVERGTRAFPGLATDLIRYGMEKLGFGREKFIEEVLELDKRTVKKIERGEPVDFVSLTKFVQSYNKGVRRTPPITFKYLTTGADEAPTGSAQGTIDFLVREQGERPDPLASVRVTIERDGATIVQAHTGPSGQCRLSVAVGSATLLSYRVEKEGFETVRGTLTLNGQASVAISLARLVTPDLTAVHAAVVRLLNRFLHGMRYFAVFQRGTGVPVLYHEDEGVRPSDLWPTAARILHHMDALEGTSGPTTPAFVASACDIRVFVVPLERFVFLGVFEEKIGDVLWHTYWERSSAEMSLAQVLRPLLGLLIPAPETPREAAYITQLPSWQVTRITSPQTDRLDANAVCKFTLDVESRQANVEGAFPVSATDFGHLTLLVQVATELCNCLAGGGGGRLRLLG